MRSIVAGFGMRIPLGKQGENLATQVQIPVVKEWKALYGEGTFQLVNKRPDEDFAYACVIHWDDEKVMWDITNTELTNVGRGVCELQYYVGDVLAKSHSWVTVIVETVYEDGATPPEPWQSWVQEVLAAGADAQGAAVSAGASAESAEHSAEVASEKAGKAEQYIARAETAALQAEGYADDAQSAKTDAETASTHYPKISDANLHWLVWDAISAAYVDTEIIAEGKDGADGTSVTVSAVSESTADGGQNIVTFSDGKTLTVKNGSKGSQGEKGEPTDVQQKTGQSITAVMSQKAVTDNLAKKVEMVSSTSPVVRLYGVRHNSTKTMMLEVQTSMAKKDSIPRRNANGTFAVGTPTNPTDAVNKEYVDTLIKSIGDSYNLIGNFELTPDNGYSLLDTSSEAIVVCQSGQLRIMHADGFSDTLISAGQLYSIKRFGVLCIISTAFVYGGDNPDLTSASYWTVGPKQIILDETNWFNINSKNNANDLSIRADETSQVLIYKRD